MAIFYYKLINFHGKSSNNDWQAFWKMIILNKFTGGGNPNLMIGIYSSKTQKIVCVGPENNFFKLFYHFLQGWTISQAFMKPLPLQVAICLQRGRYFWIKGIFSCVKLLNAWFVPRMMFRSTSTYYKYVLFFVLYLSDG